MSWYSIPKIVSNPSDNDDDYNYCSFCLINFNKYNQTINNICQTCGRVNRKVTEDKQPTQLLSAVNAPTSETEQSTSAISMEIKYSRLISQDETKKGLYSGNTRASFKTFKEAQNYLNKISDISNTTLNTRAKQREKYYVTTNNSKDRIISSNSLIIKDETGLSQYERTDDEKEDNIDNL